MAKKTSTRKTKRGARPVAKARMKEAPKRKCFKPLGRRVLVKQFGAETRSEAGLHLPVSAQEVPNEGIILELGPLAFVDQITEMTIPKEGHPPPVVLPVTVGDHVLWMNYAGTKVEIEGQEFLILVDEDLLGVVRWQTIN